MIYQVAQSRTGGHSDMIARMCSLMIRYECIALPSVMGCVPSLGGCKCRALPSVMECVPSLGGCKCRSLPSVMGCVPSLGGYKCWAFLI